MQEHHRSMFRQRALHQHLYGREKDILPHFMALPVPVLLWILLGLVFSAAFIAWDADIPVYTSGPGIVLPATSSAPGAQERASGATALVFFPWEVHRKVHVGQPTQIQFPAEGLTLSASIERILPGVTSPAATCAYYTSVAHSAASPVTRPSVAVLVNLGTSIAASSYAGSQITAQVQTGSQRIISFLPGIGKLMGGQGY